MRSIVFNGKFYAGGLNGVHRVADRLIRECDALLAALPPQNRPATRLLVPEQRRWQPSLHAIELVAVAGADGQKWEQFGLPRATGDGVLVSLANLAPIAARRQILLLHDAQFLFPDSGYPLRQRLGYRWLTPLMARRSATVLTVSDYSRQMLDLLGVVPRARSAVLYNGVDHILDTPADPGTLARLGLTRRGYALMFGSAKGYKNVRIVFDAFAERFSPVRLVVIGAAPDALAAAGLTAPPGTLFAGKCDDASLRALYEGAHSLLMPSRTEGFGLPPIEAMLCGCPAIVAPAGALPEMCRDAALYADVDDPESWRAAIRTLEGAAVRDAKLALGKKRAGHFTWARAGRELLGHVMRLADG
jgi:glycosyltransferase involved in cell wall biosynthesis